MKLTSNQLQWQKELKRIKSFIKRAEKRGYTFEDYKTPEAKPKRVTKKMLQELRSETTPTKLYKQAEYKDPTTHETLSGYAGRERERQRASKKGQRKRRVTEYTKKQGEAPVISATIYDTLSHYLYRASRSVDDYYVTLKGRRGVRGGYAQVIVYKSEVAGDLLSMLEDSRATEGDSLLVRLEANAETVNQFMADFQQASTQDQVDQSIVPLVSVLQGRVLSQEESMKYTDYTETLQGLDLV